MQWTRVLRVLGASIARSQLISAATGAEGGGESGTSYILTSSTGGASSFEEEQPMAVVSGVELSSCEGCKQGYEN